MIFKFITLKFLLKRSRNKSQKKTKEKKIAIRYNSSLTLPFEKSNLHIRKKATEFDTINLRHVKLFIDDECSDTT